MYATASDIISFIQKLVPRSTVTDIVSGWHEAASKTVDGYLLNYGYDIPATDALDMLKYAEICLYCETATRMRQFETATGDIFEDRLEGVLSKRYDKGTPMFFFAQGTSDQFLKLLPHESFRMQGYNLIEAYVKYKFRQTNARFRAGASVTQNTSSTGGWS